MIEKLDNNELFAKQGENAQDYIGRLVGLMASKQDEIIDTINEQDKKVKKLGEDCLQVMLEQNKKIDFIKSNKQDKSKVNDW